MAKREIKRVPVSQLTVDADVQRMLDRRRVAKMVREWTPEGLGVITVSHRKDGRLVIIDGQHRMAAALEAEGNDFGLQAEVFQGLTKPEEAALFRVRNTTARPSYLDSFHVRLAEGDETAHKIKEMLEKYGWRVGQQLGSTPGYFNAVAALERVYRLDPDSQVTAAERTLAVLEKAWGQATGAGDGRLVEGIGMLLARHKGRVDADNLAERLAGQPGGPMGLLGSARTLREAMRTKVTHAVAEIVTEIYNKYRKSSALPMWRS